MMDIFIGSKMQKLFLVLLILGLSQLSAKCDKHAKKLVKTYRHIQACQNNHLIWQDGSSMLYDDGQRETNDKILKHADIEDMFTYSYRSEKYKNPRHDPGRYRNDAFFRKMYGNSAAAVKKRLKPVRWLGQTVQMTSVNGVHKQLQKVANELAKYPKLKKYLTPTGGTFKWRKIAGTNRLSVHSFGAAIDIRVKYSAYWRWNKGTYRYQNNIPLQIVKIFEKHGFIWGGKWYHYDTMHFEYRPELL
jgi:hypothetical protein